MSFLPIGFVLTNPEELFGLKTIHSDHNKKQSLFQNMSFGSFWSTYIGFM